MVKSVNKIGAAILGLGGMGQVHVQAAKDSPYINKVVGYEPDESNALKRGHELGIAVTTKLEDILRDEDIKIVYIASPNEFHCSQSVQCLKAGKAVLCEKPMGLNLQEAQEMLIAEAETGGYLQIGFELHFSKMYALVKEWIDQGKIGRPLNAICNYFCSEFHLKNSWRSANKGCFLIVEKLSHYLDGGLERKLKTFIVLMPPIETDVFRRRIRRWEFSDAPDRIASKIVEVVNYAGQEDQEWMHNVYGQDIIVSQAVSEGKRPLVSAKDSFETMKLVFAAEMSSNKNRVIKLSELEGV